MVMLLEFLSISSSTLALNSLQPKLLQECSYKQYLHNRLLLFQLLWC